MITAPSPPTYTPVDGDPIAALRAGQEDALERIFRGRYTDLRETAETETEDPASAARVVERAFVQAWNEHERFDTPQALDAFLHDAVHQGAVRERYRHAVVQQFEKRTGSAPNAARASARDAAGTSPDAAWAHVAAAVHAPTAPAAADTAQRRAELSRHGAAEHVARMARRRVPWATIAMALVGGAAVTAGIWALNRTGAEVAATKALASPDARFLTSRAGQRAIVTLLDGSKVTLGPDTKLTVPPRFGADLRVVKLEGTAAFTVAKGQERPFVVRAGAASVTALATAFDVAAYPEEAVVIRVNEGRAEVKVGDAVRPLAAGGALVVERDGAVREPSPHLLDEALAWTTDRLVVANRPLREVLPLLRRWYALDLAVKDKAILDRTVSLSARLGDTRDAIGALEKGGNLKFGWEKETMVLRDAAKAKATVKGKKAR